MSRIFKDRLSTGVTPVADAFIDNYMAAANGEYVKVYLYILRHQNQEDLTLEQIADALNHTEADVKRAINYWQKAGVLENVQDNTLEGISAEQNRTSWSIDIEVPPAASKETAASQAPVSAPAYSAEQPVRTALSAGRYLIVSGKLQHTFVAFLIAILLASPGVISDSCMITGMCLCPAASTTGTDTKPPFENMISGLILLISLRA